MTISPAPVGAEQRLALAVDAARLGCWTWDTASGITIWDERLEEMHGLAPGGFGGTFEDWLAALHPADRGDCLARVEAALADPGPYTLIHRTTWPDGTVHTVECRGTVLVDDDGQPTGTTGVAIDVTMRERLVQILQKTLLPVDLPTVPGVSLAACYQPAERRIEIGGDWYAAVALPGGRLGIGVGDVAGHGLDAITHMASARFSLRALALSGDEPEVVLGRLSDVVGTFEADTMITATYGVLDPAAGTWTYATAGHVPAVLRDSDGHTSLLDEPGDAPLGTARCFARHQVPVGPGAALVLYTDGLIERRGEDLGTGLERLRGAVQAAPMDPHQMCQFLIEGLLGATGSEDDVAVLSIVLD